jgi:hypothetical protein
VVIEVLQLGFDCHECDERLQKERGCVEPGILPFYIEDDTPLYRCPLSLITEITWDYVRAYALYQKNLLPNGQAWINESQKYLDAMTVLENEVKRIEGEQVKK